MSESSGPLLLRVASVVDDADRAVLERIARGELGALDDLYERYKTMAYSIAYRITNDATLAEDVVQEAFLGAWRNASRYVEGRGSVKTWLLSIVHHRAIDAVRRRRLNGDVLEAGTRMLLTLQQHYGAAALLGWLRALGEFIVATSVTTTRRSLRDLVAAPDASVQRTADGGRAEIRAGDIVVGDVIVIASGQRLPVDGVVVSGEVVEYASNCAVPIVHRTGGSPGSSSSERQLSPRSLSSWLAQTFTRAATCQSRPHLGGRQGRARQTRRSD